MVVDKIIINVHNVKVKISCNYPKYYNYLKSHFSGVLLSSSHDNDYDIEVSVEWVKEKFNLVSDGGIL
ncbi:MAG: hypothetical protein NC820_05925 [Candidatus Omnitrophica bacterium]|nr:hypothetical protein [Candidatus Omnitrophota bacterium]